MTDSKKQIAEHDEPYIVSNVLRVHVPYTPLNRLGKPGVIESNRQIIRNESGQNKKKRFEKTDWEMKMFIVTILLIVAFEIYVSFFK